MSKFLVEYTLTVPRNTGAFGLSEPAVFNVANVVTAQNEADALVSVVGVRDPAYTLTFTTIRNVTDLTLEALLEALEKVGANDLKSANYGTHDRAYRDES